MPDSKFNFHRNTIFANFHMQLIQTNNSNEARGIFRVDVPSASVCLLVQLEKPATEEGGVTSSVYSRKEPVSICNICKLNILLIYSYYI